MRLAISTRDLTRNCLVSVGGFEPPTLPPQTERSGQTELHGEYSLLTHFIRYIIKRIK
ncbi:hypothetical protein vBSenS3_90 [Salmonella phage vB_SenS-3]|nr:hypothetical protein vBSenS3_90 [Salmonella phage vB_SenS-3]